MAREESMHFRVSGETKRKAKEISNNKPNKWYEQKVEEEYKKKNRGAK